MSIYSDGSAVLTITANGSDHFVTATGQVTSITMQPGDDLSFCASSTAGLWRATMGSVLRQLGPLIVGAATQFCQVAAISCLSRDRRAD
jgi:hypothetical protein